MTLTYPPGAFWSTGKPIFERRPMRFDIVTLFPELFAPLLTSGVTRRAFESGQVDVHMANIRSKLREADGYGVIRTVRGIGYALKSQ